jgi:hypothetical protein
MLLLCYLALYACPTAPYPFILQVLRFKPKWGPRDTEGEEAYAVVPKKRKRGDGES